MNRRPNSCVLAAGFLACGETARACGTCVYAEAWLGFPAVVDWSVIAVVWFLACSTLAAVVRFPIARVPRLRFAVPLVVVGVVAGVITFGPFTILIFAYSPAVAWLGSFRAKAAARWIEAGHARALRVFRSLGALAVAALVVTFAVERHRAGRMSQADVIDMWDSTAMTRQMMGELERREPDSFCVYRELVSKGWGFDMQRAAGRLALKGDPAVDLPLLRGAAERLRREALSGDESLKLISTSVMEAAKYLEERGSGTKTTDQ